MKRMKIKYNYERLIDLYGYKSEDDKPLFNIESPENYPTFEDSEANFIEDYLSNFASFDQYIVRMYGERIARFLSTEDPDIIAEFDSIINSILSAHLSEWARLYYALDLKYNPIYNVDGVTETVYGETERNDDYAKRKRTDKYPLYTDTTKNYSVGYNSGTEKEDSMTESINAARDIVSEDDAHKDTFTEEEHTDTVTKKGNIGVTMTQQMLEAEFEVRKKSFFRTIFKTFIEEAGFRYA